MRYEKDRRLVSICVPLFNEVDNVAVLYDRLSDTAKSIEDRYDVEFMFSDNHSDDGTWESLCALAEKDPRVKAIRFARNYGFQRSILLNFLQTQGDCVMQLDADLQDPPEMLSQFLEYWERGYLVVYGVRKERAESGLSQLVRRAGYWFIDKLSEHPIPRDAGDFRLVDRKVVEALSSVKTPDLYIRGSIANLDVKSMGVEYKRSARTAGKSKFSPGKVFQLGLVGIMHHSVVPLRLAVIAGLGALGLSAAGTVYYLILRIWNPGLPEGLASIHILVLFGIGLNSLFIGIVGEYLRKIFVILRGESSYLIESTLNLESREEIRGGIR